MLASLRRLMDETGATEGFPQMIREQAQRAAIARGVTTPKRVQPGKFPAVGAMLISVAHVVDLMQGDVAGQRLRRGHPGAGPQLAAHLVAVCYDGPHRAVVAGRRDGDHPGQLPGEPGFWPGSPCGRRQPTADPAGPPGGARTASSPRPRAPRTSPRASTGLSASAAASRHTLGTQHAPSARLRRNIVSSLLRSPPISGRQRIKVLRASSSPLRGPAICRAIDGDDPAEPARRATRRTVAGLVARGIVVSA